MNRVLVTGSSGNVGREVMKALRQVGIAARGTYSNLPREELEDSTQFNFLDKATWGPALQGIDGLFLLRPPPISDVRPTLNAFFDFAVTRGVKHTVFLSVLGAGKNKLVPHHQVEGRSIQYEPASALGYALHLRRRRMPTAQVLVQTILHVGLRFGQAEGVDGTSERLLGRRPHDLESFIRDHAGLWKPHS